MQTHYFSTSSQVKKITYLEKEKMLTVYFSSGSTYSYIGVSQTIYDQFCMSLSPGKFVHQMLNGYIYHKL